MKIISLTIDGYKKFHPSITVAFNKDINLLIGINGSGKSSIFEAVAIIFSEVKKYCQDGLLQERRFGFTISYSYITRATIDETSNTIETKTSINLIQLSSSKESGLEYTMAVNGRILNTASEMLEYLPDNLVFYYAGFCDTLKEIVQEAEAKQAEKLRTNKAQASIPKLLSKQIIYIKRKHFPLLFLLNYIGQNSFTLPLTATKYKFQKFTIYLKKPESFKSNDHLNFYGLTGFLRKYLDNLLIYSRPLPENGEGNRIPLEVDFDLGFISALEDLGGWVDKHYSNNQNYLLFHIFNLLFQVDLVDSIDILIRKDDDDGRTIIDIEDLSEGEQQLITIGAIKKVLCLGNSILVLDEPDAFLHPQRQRDLIPHLQEIFTESDNQIILATHSPFVAQSIDFHNITLFESNGQIRRIENQVLDYKAVNDVLFGVDERFSETIEHKLSEFNEYRDKIFQNAHVNKVELKSLVLEIEGFGEETAIIIARELAQLQRLKNFDLNG